MTPEKLVEALVPLAAELVGTLRDYGPDDVAAVLARVPDFPDSLVGRTGGKYGALAVVLAAMVDPDARPGQLLAWADLGPVPSRDVVPSHLELRNLPGEAWGRRRELREEVAELTGKGMSAKDIAERVGITSRSVHRHQQALRDAAEVA